MAGYAVIKTGGKQYRVQEEDVLVIERLNGGDDEPLDAGETVVFDEVLMLSGANGAPVIGAPRVAGAAVTAEVLDQRRAEKITIIKSKRRNTYQRKLGHRQHETVVRITGISADGAPAAKKKKAKPAPKDDAPASAPAAEPLGFLQAADGEPDDLKQISGVGPALEKKLHGLGITKFHQIAALSPEEVEKIDAVLNFKGRIDRDDWIGQAKTLAGGDNDD